MIIGINFTGIAEDVQALEDYRKALHLKPRIKAPGAGRYEWHYLKGLTNKEDHAKKMFFQAHNGRRSIIEIQAPKGWIAFYIR